MKKINIAHTAETKGMQSPDLDLIQVIKDAYSDIQECFLMQVKPIEELPKINVMAAMFKMSVSRAPNKESLADWRSDYARTAVMIYDRVPSFDELMEFADRFEKEFNDWVQAKDPS
jgi:hypothetical protein